jgi:tRNA A-37 threonylcarbamoyl transferase component Bud32
VTCPSLDDLWSGAGAEHARSCDDCRAILELAEPPALPCEVAEVLIAARAAGPLAPDRARLLDGHLGHCAACRALTGALLELGLPDAVAAELARNFEDLAVVPAETYVRGDEIGRGGMGQIVRARDRRLGRTVAIKELIDPQLQARFEREARLTARLQHPAIVPIYEAGRWPSGAPFYAMKYVAGRPLDEVVAARPAFEDRLALLVHVTAAVEAIAYAHGEGVVHRDLKPQNILVGRFGETVVIDWGLAKDLSAAELEAPFRGGGGALTEGGAGTPAYMAPEQARGAPPDERLDVYALGATLHHVLAGDRPDLRALPAATPPDLRAIVAKATAADPAARYPSAAELAGELVRFQRGQLVAAHRYTARELARRWLRRHRALAAVVAVAAALGIAGTALGVSRIVAERDRATAQRRSAEQLVDYMLGTLRDRLEPIGKLDVLAGVGQAVERYLGSLPDGDATPADALRRGEALYMLGSVDLEAGNFADASAENARARRLCEQPPATSDSAACAALAIGGLATAASYGGHSDAALALLDEEHATLAAAIRRDPGNARLRRVSSTERYLAGREQIKRGDYARGRAAMGDGIAVLAPLVAPGTTDLIALKDLAALHRDLCNLEVEDGHPEAALDHCERAAAARAAERAIEPQDAEAEVGWATATADASNVLLLLGAWPAAHDRIEAALEVLRRRAASDPANDLWRSYLASALHARCAIERELARGADTAQACVDAAAGFDALLAHDPEREDAAVNLVGVELDLADARLAAHDVGAARAAAERALAIAHGWDRKQPGKFEWLVMVADAERVTALVARAEHRLADARASATAARAAIARTTGPIVFDREQTRLRTELLAADLDGEAGDRAAAVTRLRATLRALADDRARWPRISDLAGYLAFAQIRLAELTDDEAEAAAARAAALALLARTPILAREFRGLAARARGSR